MVYLKPPQGLIETTTHLRHHHRRSDNKFGSSVLHENTGFEQDRISRIMSRKMKVKKGILLEASYLTFTPRSLVAIGTKSFNVHFLHEPRTLCSTTIPACILE